MNRNRFARGRRSLLARSINGKEGFVRALQLHAESTNADDTFPPIIASYRVQDGWLVYAGRNGSEGVVVGTAAELAKWKRQVDAELGSRPIATYRPWKSSDGGKARLQRATIAANRTAALFGLPKPRVEFVTVSDGKARGDYSGKLTLYNAHLAGTVQYQGRFDGMASPTGEHLAAHEMAHHAFATKDGGHAAMRTLEQFRAKHGAVTFYHALSNSFEGLMDTTALYVLHSAEVTRRAPKLAAALRAWSRG